MTPCTPGPIAVIDIGATSIRMSVAQVLPDGSIETLDRLRQSIALGKDTFTTRTIQPDTIEACVQVLRSFREVLREYKVHLESRVYAVATSAVREAVNRDAFVDRIYMATGVLIEIVDEAEVTRLTYLSIEPLLRKRSIFGRRLTLVCEVGGGSTEILGLSGPDVRFAFSYHLGSLRIREMLEEYEGKIPDLRNLMESHIRNAVMQIERNIERKEPAQILLMGGEARLAAEHLHPEWDKQSILNLSVNDLSNWTQRVVDRSVDELVRRYNISYPEAEVLAPTLLCQVYLARALKLKNALICTANLRDGLLRDLVHTGEPSEAFTRQIVHSALEIGEKYHFDRKHAEQVSEIAVQIFRALREDHQLGAHHETILKVAGLLHDIGGFISNRGHHKHSMYLIRNSDLFGLGPRDLELVALAARYHRKALPNPNHYELQRLRRARRLVMVKLAAILRVADALDRAHNRRLSKLEISLAPGQLILEVKGQPDLSLEQMALSAKSDLFEQIYGRTVMLRHRRSGNAI